MNTRNNRFLWQFSLPVSLLALSIFVVSAKEDSNSPEIVHFRASAPSDLVLYPSLGDDEVKVEGHAPMAGARLAYSSNDGQFHVDYSHYSRQTASFKSYPIDEFIYIIEGQVEMINDNGSGAVYGPGDMFLIPKGFRGTWRQITDVKKIAVMHGEYIFGNEH